MLGVHDISLRFGHLFALKNVTFCVASGEIAGVIGPNGAGKTTLLEIVSGLLPADRGVVSWHGTALPSARRKHRIGGYDWRSLPRSGACDARRCSLQGLAAPPAAGARSSPHNRSL